MDMSLSDLKATRNQSSIGSQFRSSIQRVVVFWLLFERNHLPLQAMMARLLQRILRCRLSIGVQVCFHEREDRFEVHGPGFLLQQPCIVGSEGPEACLEGVVEQRRPGALKAMPLAQIFFD